MTQIIKQTPNYTLLVEDTNTIPHVPCYKIKNRKYGVVEIETFLLPQAIKYLDDLEASLAASYDSSTIGGLQ